MKLTELLKELQEIYDELGECDVMVDESKVDYILAIEEPDCETDSVCIYSDRGV